MEINYKDAAKLVAILNEQAMHLAIIAKQNVHPMIGILSDQAKEAHELATKIRDKGQFCTEPNCDCSGAIHCPIYAPGIYHMLNRDKDTPPAPQLPSPALRPLNIGESPRKA